MSVQVRPLYFLLAVLMVYLFVLQTAAIWPFTIDDMYIPLRYARHWVEGEGLLWNVNQPPVEGYSSFSFMVLAALSLKIGMDPVIVLKITGILGLALTCMALLLITRLWLSWSLSWIPPIWLLWYKGQIIWSVSGLETAVYEALIAWASLFAFKALGYGFNAEEVKNQSTMHYLLCGLLLALASLTRPEAPVFALMFFVLFLGHKRQGCLKGTGLFAVIFLTIYLPYFLWRYHYFGRIFPNPVYCKGLTGHAWAELSFNYLKLAWPFLLLTLPAIRSARERHYLFLLLPSLIYMLLLIGADPIVAFYNRLFLPAFALLLPLSLLGFVRLLGGIVAEKNRFYPWFVYALTMLFAAVFIPAMSLRNYQFFSKNPVEGEQLRQEVVDWLKSHVSADKSIVLSDSGYIPFYSPHSFIDSYCLNNAKMSRSSSKVMYQRFCEDTLQQKPEVIILTSLIEPGKTRYTPADACLSEALSKTRDYRKEKVFKTDTKDSYYQYELFKRSLGPFQKNIIRGDFDV